MAVFDRVLGTPPLLEQRRPFEVDEQAAQRVLGVEICRTHHTINNAGAPAVTVVQMNGAGDGNRTHVTSLEGWRTTIVLRPLFEECWRPVGACKQGQQLEYLAGPVV